MRWSRLQKLVEDLFDPHLNLRIFCTVHRSDDGPAIGRYWITKDKEIIWEIPRRVAPLIVEQRADSGASEVTSLLRQYVEFSPEMLAAESYPLDSWGLMEILRAADRRMGRRRLDAILPKTENECARALIQQRLMK